MRKNRRAAKRGGAEVATGWSGGRGWLISAVVAGTTLLALLALFRRPVEVRNASVAPEAVSPAVTLARGADELLSDEAAMRDPTPLFLPTRFNATEEAFAAGARRELSSAFRGFEPKLKYGENDLTLTWPAVVQVPGRVADAFAKNDPARSFAGFGQTGAAIAPLSSRAAFVEVVSAGDGELIFARALNEARPPGERTWQPLQFLVAVDRSGVVGPPVLTQSSTVAAIDSYFQDCLLEVLHVGERLGPGFYRVGVGP